MYFSRLCCHQEHWHPVWPLVSILAVSFWFSSLLIYRRRWPKYLGLNTCVHSRFLAWALPSHSCGTHQQMCDFSLKERDLKEWCVGKYFKNCKTEHFYFILVYYKQYLNLFLMVMMNMKSYILTWHIYNLDWNQRYNIENNHTYCLECPSLYWSA